MCSHQTKILLCVGQNDDRSIPAGIDKDIILPVGGRIP